MKSRNLSKQSSKTFGNTPLNSGVNHTNFRNSISQKSITTNLQTSQNIMMQSGASSLNINIQQQTDQSQKKQRDQYVQILNGLNFALNPKLLKSKRNNDSIQNKMSVEVLSDKTIAQPSQLTRNLLEFRKMQKLSNSKSLQLNPKLKQVTYLKGNLSVIKGNTQQTRDLLTKKNQSYTKMSMFKSDGEKTTERNRMQLVNWLQENKKELVQLLSDKQVEIAGTVQYLEEINKAEFEHILHLLGFKQDKCLFDKLFWLFDANNNKWIDAYEVEYALKIFKEHSVDENVELFFYIANGQNPKYIKENELKQIFINNLQSLNDQKVAKIICQDFYNSLGLRSPQKGISKQELQVLCLTDYNIRNLISKNTRIIKTGKQELYQTPSQYLVCEQSVKNEGIFFSEDENIFKAFEEKESSYNIAKLVKQEMNMIKKLNKKYNLFQLEGEHSDQDDSENEQNK